MTHEHAYQCDIRHNLDAQYIKRLRAENTALREAGQWMADTLGEMGVAYEPWERLAATDPCIHGPGVARCGHPDCTGARSATAEVLT